MTARARDPQDARGPAGLTPDVERGTGAPAAGSREAMEHARWIAEREDYTFAECTLAEEIVARARKIVALLESAPAPAEAAEAAPSGDVERVVRAAEEPLLRLRSWFDRAWPDYKKAYPDAAEMVDDEFKRLVTKAIDALAALRGAPAASPPLALTEHDADELWGVLRQQQTSDQRRQAIARFLTARNTPPAAPGPGR